MLGIIIYTICFSESVIYVCNILSFNLEACIMYTTDVYFFAFMWRVSITYCLFSLNCSVQRVFLDIFDFACERQSRAGRVMGLLLRGVCMTEWQGNP